MEHSCIQRNLGSSLIAKLLGPHWFMFLFSANPDSCVQQISLKTLSVPPAQQKTTEKTQFATL